MKCPFCDKQINGLTGLQEIKNFMTHLNSQTRGCKKNPKKDTTKHPFFYGTSMQEALEIRANSGQ